MGRIYTNALTQPSHLNLLRKMANRNFFSRLFNVFSGQKSRGARVSYDEQGRCGYVWYQSAEARFPMYYEFGGGDCIASLSVPGPEDWVQKTGLPLERRDEVLAFVGRQVAKDKTRNGSFRIEGNWLNIYG